MAPRNAQFSRTSDTSTEDDRPADKPATSEWIAMANLSVSRETQKGGQPMADIVHKGEAVHLTEDEAHGFLTGHRVPVIRRKGDHDADRSITARHLFGKAPGAAAFGAREDPPDASRIEVVDPGPRNPADPMSHPEAHDPQTDLNVDPDAKKDR